MRNRENAIKLFLSEVNISYIASELKTFDPNLKNQMNNFVHTHRNYITNSSDVWFTVRELNRAFIKSFEKCISVEDLYSSWGEEEFKATELGLGSLI